MTSWLKWRLAGLLAVATLGGGWWVHAQERSGLPPLSKNAPRPPRTPEAAAELFLKWLSLGNRPNFEWSINSPYAASLSRWQLGIMAIGGFEKTMTVMAREVQVSQFRGRLKSEKNGQRVVEVTPLPPSKTREVVVIAEDGGFRVDLKATFGKWNNLSGTALDEDWFRRTGADTPAMLDNIRWRGGCQSQMKDVMRGVILYTHDYDDKLPPARAWQNAVTPYVKVRELFTCPVVPKGKANGYAFNQKLSQLPQEKIDDFALVVGLYETTNLAPNAFGTGAIRAYRHVEDRQRETSNDDTAANRSSFYTHTRLQGSNFAFADGHVKWFYRGKEPKNHMTFDPFVTH